MTKQKIRFIAFHPLTERHCEFIFESLEEAKRHNPGFTNWREIEFEKGDKNKIY